MMTTITTTTATQHAFVVFIPMSIAVGATTIRTTQTYIGTIILHIPGD